MRRRTFNSRSRKSQSDRNLINNKISNYKKNNEDCTNLIHDMKNISIKIKALDNDLNQFKISLENKLKYIPNIIHGSVPVGKSANDNKVVKKWGSSLNLISIPKVI